MTMVESIGMPYLVAFSNTLAVVAHSRDAAHTSGNVVGQLGHEENVTIAHDGYRPLGES